MKECASLLEFPPLQGEIRWGWAAPFSGVAPLAGHVAPLEIPGLFTKVEHATETTLPWNVVLYNDDVHTINEVILQVQKATGISLEAAFEITMTVHTKGRAICYAGAHTECEKVASVLKEIGLTVEIVLAEG
ncbi:MAG: ATP-dependent Clp protease adaptor ClpS [Nitrospirae bacterium]|nr:ATP-dependent Clp protease adaptor ClpS [Candidatus Troglogloeales bacterium]MBI3598552.1 ATP-dependent Clp protease adaptor ClpS [Candidatus Troglogloeales bacterium]